MEKLVFKYSLDDKLSTKELFTFGLQWFLVIVPFVIILGKVAGAHDYPGSPALQLTYLQKLFLATGLTLVFQVLWGHCLPLIVGPAAVLLSGILTNQGADAAGSTYFSMAVCGLLLAVLSACNVLKRLSLLFTTRIVAIVLLLIALTMIPTILNLITAGSEQPFTQLLFAFGMILALLLAQKLLPAGIKATMIVWALVLGTLAYHGLVGGAWPAVTVPPSTVGQWQLVLTTFRFEPVVLISFLFCFLALMANDLGSIQSTAGLLAVADAERRSKSGLLFTGLGNVLAGCMGVIGPVNYSFSGGIILATGCAARLPLVAAAGGMMVVALVPELIGLFAYIPPVVAGSLLFYTMCLQAAAGLMLAGKTLAAADAFDTGLMFGVSLLLGTLTAFMPGAMAAAIPPMLRPLLTNGFVVGVTAALVLEHVIFAIKAPGTDRKL